MCYLALKVMIRFKNIKRACRFLFKVMTILILIFRVFIFNLLRKSFLQYVINVITNKIVVACQLFEKVDSIEIILRKYANRDALKTKRLTRVPSIRELPYPRRLVWSVDEQTRAFIQRAAQELDRY